MRHEFVPAWSVLLGSCVEFFNDSGGGVESSDVGNLAGELLVLGTNAAISIDHNIRFLSVLKQTKVCSDAYIMPCLGPFVSALGQKLVLCLQRVVLVLN